MTNSVDPNQTASSEANWSRSTLLAKAGDIWAQQDQVNQLCLFMGLQGPDWLAIQLDTCKLEIQLYNYASSLLLTCISVHLNLSSPSFWCGLLYWIWTSQLFQKECKLNVKMMILCFKSLSTLFKSYWDDEKVLKIE